MRNRMKKLVCLILSASILQLNGLSPFITTRSQGENAARDIVGLTNFINLGEKCNPYGTFYGTLEYTRSSKSRSLAECLFGTDIVSAPCTCDPSIVISGSQTTGRAATDWLADNFGLPTDFKSVVSFRPLIQNVVLDLGFYVGFDEWIEGLYFRANAPITHTKWDMRMFENISKQGSNPDVPGYYSPSGNSNLLHSFTDFISGSNVPTLNDLTVANQAGEISIYPGGIFDPLLSAKISPSALVCAGLAEFRAALGWNWACEDYHVGFNLRFAAPTGTKPKGVFAFEPTVGNGYHWQVGVGLSGHYDFWVSCDGDAHAGIFVDANITHLFNARQKRTFDLKNKPNSRYMLAQKINATQSSAYTDRLNPPPTPVLEFQNEFSPVANLTTFTVDVSIPVQGDLVIMLNYTSNNWSFDLGYNYWAIGCEKIKRACSTSPFKCSKKCPPTPTSIPFAENTWALKGDAAVIGFDPSSPTPPFTFVPVRLAATENSATIHAGTNFPAAGTTDLTVIAAAEANPNIDNIQPAVASASGLPVRSQPTSPLATPQTNSSNPPIFIKATDVDIVGNQGSSNKLFAHFNYMWLERDCWTPYLGFGAEVEWGSSGKCGTSCNTNNTTTTSTTNCNTSCKTTCNPCFKCSVSQWGVWLKGGVAFN